MDRVDRTHGRRTGLTILEILVVIAIIGIAASIGAALWRDLARSEEARAALVSARQAFWQGATSAAARGDVLTLSWDGAELLLADEADDVVRRWDFAPEATSLPLAGVDDIASFTPPGRVETDYDPFTVEVNGRTATVDVALIGETEVTW